MKPKNINIMAAGLSLLAGMSFAACEKTQDTGCNGAPEILMVSPVTDRGEDLENCDLSQYVIVQGRNFCNVDRITINGIDADMENAFITPNEVTFQVPRKAPESTPTNQVILYAGVQQTVKNMVVDIPALKIEGMESEYVPVGKNLVVLGKNFDIWTKKVFMNDTEVEVVKADIDTLVLKIPEALVATTCKVKILDVQDNEKSVPYYYRDARNTPVTFEPYTGTWLTPAPGGNGNGEIITEGTTPAPASGAYCKVTGVSNGSWSWELISNQSMILPDDVIINPGNYLLKWEYNNLAPYPGNMLQVQIGSQGGGQDGSKLVDTKGKWKTYSMPVSSVIANPMQLDPGKNYAVTLAIVKSQGTGLAMDISFDNIRIVPKE